jgi:uncharacterized protein YjgD (DUF1641 family)
MAEPISLHQNVNGATHAEASRPTAAELHVDAVESAYEVLQLLHDRGVLSLLRGLLGAGDRVIDTLVEAINTPESIRAIRNFLLLTKSFGNIRPEVLNSLVQAATEGAHREKSHRAPGFFELYRKLRNEDTRHALALTLDLMESVGKDL